MSLSFHFEIWWVGPLFDPFLTFGSSDQTISVPKDRNVLKLWISGLIKLNMIWKFVWTKIHFVNWKISSTKYGEKEKLLLTDFICHYDSYNWNYRIINKDCHYNIVETVMLVTKCEMLVTFSGCLYPSCWIRSKMLVIKMKNLSSRLPYSSFLSPTFVTNIDISYII